MANLSVPTTNHGDFATTKPVAKVGSVAKLPSRSEIHRLVEKARSSSVPVSIGGRELLSVEHLLAVVNLIRRGVVR